MRVLLLVVFGLSSALIASSAAGETRLESLAWMCGSWGIGGDTVETWTAPEDGLMLGHNRAGRPGKSPFFEYLRIEERPSGIVYVASPLGRGATEFALTDTAGKRVVFENPEHDFPQRIAYWLEDESTLVAEISAGEGDARRAQASRWPRLSACECSD